jgi:hypothetical protein
VSITFRKAVRENVALLIGLAGGTGSGKSFSAMRLASGIAGGKPFAVIDTENRRALHYAEKFAFDHADLRAPFRPDAYASAIADADAAGYSVIVVDQMSYEHAGEGGLLDWQEEELTRMAGDDWKKRESCKMASWIKPKSSHKHMMQKLLQVRAHLILCFRAEEKIEMVRGEDGKMKIQPKQALTGIQGWIPIAEKSLPYELTASFLLTADAPGVPKPIKLQEQHRKLFPLDKPITEESGRMIAEWAKGGSVPADEVKPMPYSVFRGIPPTDEQLGRITTDQAIILADLCKENGVDPKKLCDAARVNSIDELTDYQRARQWLDRAIALRGAPANRS